MYNGKSAAAILRTFLFRTAAIYAGQQSGCLLRKSKLGFIYRPVCEEGKLINSLGTEAHPKRKFQPDPVRMDFPSGQGSAEVQRTKQVPVSGNGN